MIASHASMPLHPSRSLSALGCLNVYATSPQSLDSDQASYLRKVIEVARWSEDTGCTGTLVYTDNSIVDPWLVAQTILSHTERLVPLVAVQPVYMHPYSAAKMVTSLGFLHNRSVALNMVAGGFKNDLLALNDETPHDKRYDRLIEYTQIMIALLENSGPVSFSGEYYKIDKVQLKPFLPAELRPRVFLSGSSPAGMAAAALVGGTAVQYPKPPGEAQSIDGFQSCGVRIGIIARETDDEAWEVAFSRFPADRKGQITHGLAMRVSDSAWHKQLSTLSERQDAYWLGPFQNSKSNCPYLVGSYEVVASELGKYIEAGYRTFILDIPPSHDELQNVQRVFARAVLGQGEVSQ
jgi:alkanesulfonate monooxygenase